MSEVNIELELQLPASEEQLAAWETRFRPYRRHPSRDCLIAWLNQFDEKHQTIAHRVLDSVILLSEDDILRGYKGTLESLPGWSKKPDERMGRWFFVGMGDAGESGQAMLRLFREANGLAADRWQSLCVMPRELPGLALKAVDSVVFVDDFAGSGQQMVNYWPIIEELVASEARCYLALSATTSRAELEIRAKTEFDVRAPVILQEKDNLFSEACATFTDEEKLVLEEYGKRASRSQPRGFGDCGLAIVLSHKTPNNSVPILHANHANWISPFPRQLIPVAA
ncbi:phosphoribosyltransferase-like protein [Brevundimonas diminuta]